MLDQVTGPVPADLARADGGECSSVLDETLILRIAAGNTLAMRALFARHHVRVFRFIRSLSADAALANGLVTETFVDAWGQAGSYDGSCAVSTWLLALARTKTDSALHRRAALNDTLGLEHPPRVSDIAIKLGGRIGILRRCLDALSREDREVLDLVYYHEQPVDAVAYIMGVPESAVVTRMSSARRALNKLLAAGGVERV